MVLVTLHCIFWLTQPHKACTASSVSLLRAFPISPRARDRIIKEGVGGVLAFSPPVIPDTRVLLFILAFFAFFFTDIIPSF
jgi:hypothetical protein